MSPVLALYWCKPPRPHKNTTTMLVSLGRCFGPTSGSRCSRTPQSHKPQHQPAVDSICFATWMANVSCCSSTKAGMC